MPITNATRRQLSSTGVVLNGGVWGGAKKQMYYTPSGDEICATPSLREWVRYGENGQVAELGTRDSNLDKGWLLAPPAVPILHCKGCDKWHDTQADVDKCIEAKARVARKWETRARKQMGTDSKGSAAEVAALTNQVEELKAMVAQLISKESSG